MKKDGTMTTAEANQVYDVLVEQCGALESYRDNFIYCHVTDRVAMSGNSEYRIGGKLGFGGKFRMRAGEKLYVDYYSEDDNKTRAKIVAITNEALAQLATSFKSEE